MDMEWVEKLPDSFKTNIAKDIDAKREKQEREESGENYDCLSFIWRHQPATKDSLEKCYIEIQFTEQTNYQIVIEEQLPTPEEDSPICFIICHVNRHPCDRFRETRKAKEAALEWVTVYLTGLTYMTVDIAPTGLIPHKNRKNFSTPFLSKCKKLTIRGTWDYNDDNLVGEWLAKIKGKEIIIISGSTCARIHNSPILMSAASVSITGFTNIGQTFLHDFEGQNFKLEGSVVQLINGAGIVNMLSKWMRSSGDFEQDVILEGVMEPTFFGRIHDHFRNHGLLEKCIIDDKTKNLKFDHIFGRYRIQIITKANFICANLHAVQCETPEKRPAAKKSSAKKSGSKKK